MFIKRLKPNVYDVFVGSGWNNWTRVTRTQSGVQVVSGNMLDQKTLNHVKTRITR